MFGNRELRTLISTCTTFGITRKDGESELAYSYEDFKGAAEKIGMNSIPSALVLFAMLREVGFSKAQNAGDTARMSAPLLTVARIAYELTQEFAAEFAAEQASA